MDHQPLLKIVERAHTGKVLLPEFQRDFVWQPDAIRELLTSIFQGYYIGTFLFLETSVRHSLFPTRAIAGAPKVAETPDKINLVLDGQQRISALYYATYEPHVPLKQKKHPTRFYVDVSLAGRGDLDEAVKYVSTHGKRHDQFRSDLAAGRVVSVKMLADEDGLNEHIENTKGLAKHRKVLRQLGRALATHPVHIIDLETDDIDNIVNVFERTNRTGLRLGMFDLAVARCYPKDVNLRKSWDAFQRAQPEIAGDTDRDVPLKIMALANGRVPKAKPIFALLDQWSRDDIETEWDAAVRGLRLARERLRKEYGAVVPSLVPYLPMILPLGALLERIEQKKLTAAGTYAKIDRWYWASLLLERYDAGGNTTAFEDIGAVWEWIKAGTCPDWLEELANGTIQATPELAGCTGGALARTVECLYWTRGPMDLMTGQLLEKEDLDHVFPASSLKGVAERDWILNRAPSSEDTNRRLKLAKSPKQFLKECLEGHGDDESSLRETLESQFISEKAQRYLVQNDLRGFLLDREKAVFAELHSRATGIR